MDSISKETSRRAAFAHPVLNTVLALGALMALNIPAQSAEPAQTAANETSGLAEVIVTAQFRAENLQETPLSITAISGDQLATQGLTNVADLGLVIPNANIRQQGNASGPNPQIGMRGVQTTDFIYTTEPGVAIYVDDVYHGTLTGSAMDLLDLERVEVLRGPQGTLFGKNALGGAIHLISKQPKGDNSGYVEAATGSSRLVDLKAGFDFSILDNLFMRVSGVAKRINGYQDVLDFPCEMKKLGTPQLAGSLPSLLPSNEQNAGNCKIGEFGGKSTNAVRAMLRYLATDDLEFNLTADYSRTDDQPPPETVLTGRQPGLDSLYTDGPGGIFQRFGVRIDDTRFIPPSYFTTYANYNDPMGSKNWPTDQIIETRSASAKVNYRVNDYVRLKLVAARRTYDGSWASDQDYTPFDLNTTYNLQHHEQNSAELQLSGTLFTTVDWTAGAFYYDSKSKLGGFVTFGAFDYLGIIPNFAQNDRFTTKSKSGYAHVAWRATDALTLTAGVRETSEDKTFTFDHTNFLTILTPLQYGQSHFDWKAAVDYKITNSIMTYGSVSTGFRSDGAQPRPFVRNELTSVPAEEITAYEIGLKSDFFEHRLRVNLAGFINDYSPRVTSRFGYSCNLANDTTPGPYFPPGPAAQACPAGTPMAGLPGWLWFSPFSAPGKDKGLELEVTAQPVRNLLINASAGYLKFVSGAPPGSDGYVDPSVREQPRLSYSVGAQYDINLGQGGSITPRFDLFYQGERTNGTVSQVQVSPDNIVPSYTLVNARLTYTSPDAKWMAALSAENLLNKFYWAQLVSATDAAGAQTFNRTGVPGRPREVAVTLRHNF